MKQRGFTLIELMVVVSIISLLASMVLAAVSAAHDKADNAYRMQTVGEYAKAVLYYRYDKGNYPLPASGPNVVNCLAKIACDGDVSIGTILLGYITLGLPFSPITGTDLFNNSATVTGPYYFCAATSNSVCTQGAIEWFLRGNQNCVLMEATDKWAINKLFYFNPPVGTFCLAIFPG